MMDTELSHYAKYALLTSLHIEKTHTAVALHLERSLQGEGIRDLFLPPQSITINHICSLLNQVLVLADCGPYRVASH